MNHKQVIYTTNFMKANWAGMLDTLASINWHMILAHRLDTSSC